MTTDLENGSVSPESQIWLRSACGDLGREIQRTHALDPNRHALLGFDPDDLMSGPDPLLGHWRRELGDKRYLEFLRYWYRHSLANRPMAFARKVAQQIAVFYSADCPAFRSRRRLSMDYTSSLSALSRPQVLPFLARIPVGMSFFDTTNGLQLKEFNVYEVGLVRRCNKSFARTYLATLFVTVAIAGWLLINRGRSAGAMPGALLALFFYAANFGNVLGISIVHSMEVWRYSGVQYPAALLAHFWAIRWLLQLGLAKLSRSDFFRPILPSLRKFIGRSPSPEISNGMQVSLG